MSYNGKTLKFRTQDGILIDNRTDEIKDFPLNVCILTTAYKYNAFGKYYTNEIRFLDESVKVFDEKTNELVKEFVSLDEFKKYKEQFNKEQKDGRFRYQQVVYFFDEATKKIGRIYLGYYSYAKFWDYMDEIKSQNKKLFSQSTKINVRSILPETYGLTFTEGEAIQNLDEIIKYKKSLEDDVWSGRLATSKELAKSDGVVGEQKVKREDVDELDYSNRDEVCKIYVFGKSLVSEKEMEKIIKDIYDDGGYSDKRLKVDFGPLDFDKCRNDRSIYQKCRNSDGVIHGCHGHSFRDVDKIKKLDIVFIPPFKKDNDDKLDGLEKLDEKYLENSARELFGKLFQQK